MAFAFFRMPVPIGVLVRRVAREILDDQCLGLAAQLAYYFLLALFPALIFLVALVGLLPVHGVLADWLTTLSAFVPADVVAIVRGQLTQIQQGNSGSLLTVGVAGAIWSSSTAMSAIISTLNAAYDLPDRRPWWKTRLLAIALTLSLAVFLVLAQGLILFGPVVADLVTAHTGIPFGPAWSVGRWVLALVLVVTALDLIYHFAPDARSEFTWLTPGALVASALWVGASLAFRAYLAFVADVNATYGALGGIIVVLLWLYLSGLAILVGAEVNAEIDHAAPHGDQLDANRPGGPSIGVAAEHAHRSRRERQRA